MKITWKQTLPVWWSVAWRGFLYGLVGGFILGFIGGVIAAMNDPSMATTYGRIGGYVAAIPASMLAIKQALSAHLDSLAAIAQNGAAGEAQDVRA